MSNPQIVKASVLHGPRDLQVEDRPLPPLPPDSVLVSIKTTTLCGSDLHYFNHFRNGDILVREPLTLGHESAGIITAIGSHVTSLAIGDHVALEVGQPCETPTCPQCLSGRYNICPEMKFRSSAKAYPHAQGTLQEVIVHPARWCHKLPENVSLDMGALAEPLSVALHAFDRAKIEGGSKVLVLGAGAVGLLCAAVVKSLVKGVRVAIADIQSERVDFAVQNGFADAGVVVPMREKRPEGVEEKLDFARELAELVGNTEIPGRGEAEKIGQVNVSFECTGVESCLQAAIYTTSPGGKILLIGMGNPVQTLPISAASLREVDLLGVFRYANTYPRAIELLSGHSSNKDEKSSGPVLPDLAKLITHRFSGMENIPQAFDMAKRVKDNEGKLVLKVMVDL